MSIKANSSSQPKNPALRSKFLREKQGRIGSFLAISNSSGKGATSRESFIDSALAAPVLDAGGSGTALLPSIVWAALTCKLCVAFGLVTGAEVLLLRRVS